ncbi:hypothetical protein [Mucilaginibacter jinjuensis]|uniref:Uncharacterized protein n=1 Tax=Mucilaginibacter jinjuensis TaxID=1176721 RepID=A0ABY7T4W3_9SPHI|nr:hypothetical protein [Mucilaginibacter jinjuensis]WCT11505.1 hypothetical protein PQO05_22455 [Mucilaginibacter jinjuensis]
MRKAAKKKPFIYYENLKPYEIIAIALYGIATLIITLSSFLGNYTDDKQELIIIYISSPSLFLYFFFHKSLRNFKSYLIWIGFAVFHIILFFAFESKPQLHEFDGKPPLIFFNTIMALLLFQLLRYLSIIIQHKEFILPTKGEGKDLFEVRKPTWVDNLLFVTYMAIWVTVSIFFSSHYMISGHILPVKFKYQEQQSLLHNEHTEIINELPIAVFSVHSEC